MVSVGIALSQIGKGKSHKFLTYYLFWEILAMKNYYISFTYVITVDKEQKKPLPFKFKFPRYLSLELWDSLTTKGSIIYSRETRARDILAKGNYSEEAIKEAERCLKLSLIDRITLFFLP